MTFRSAARAAVATVLYYSGALCLHRHVSQRDSAMILLYHRVLRPDEVEPGLDPAIYVTTDTFEMHLQYVKQAYDVVDLDALLEWREGRWASDKPPCVITFDDGWSDNYTNAFPLLKRYDARATIFIITSQMGSAGFVTWEQVREMEEAGIRFGSHTVTHPVVAGLPAAQLERELSDSKRELRARTTRPSCWFCYPKGYNDVPAREAATRHYCGAVTTVCAPTQRGDNLYQIPRVSIHDDITSTPSTFALRLAGWTRTPTG